MSPALKPFFSYFGSKYRLAPLYPPPVHDEIIEPFAGSAGYSLLYSNRKVHLYDSYEPIIAVWNYLIRAKESEILSLPLGPFSKENPISAFSVAPEAKSLIGFWLTESQTKPSSYPQSKSRGGGWNKRRRFRIANQLKYIRHWKASLSDYASIDNRNATWYIDPPYFVSGHRYADSAINYKDLAEWCLARNGQQIVCEMNGAEWLPFKPLRYAMNASNKQYTELVYTNGEYDGQQKHFKFDHFFDLTSV